MPHNFVGKNELENKSPSKRLLVEQNIIGQKSEKLNAFVGFIEKTFEELEKKLVNHIDEKIKESETRTFVYICKKCEKFQRSLQYDVEQRSLETIKVIQSVAFSSDVKTFLEKSLTLPLPVETLDKFLFFEDDLKKSAETRENLVNF